MRKFIFGAFVLTSLFTGCKSMQQMKNNDAATTPAQEETTKVFAVTEPQPTTKTTSLPATTAPATTTTTYQAPAKPVRTQTETFTFDQKDDAAKYSNSTFFVIIGSFSSVENANRYKQELVPQGFNPIVLHSETGYYRVCVNSYGDETAARQRVNQIRVDFP